MFPLPGNFTFWIMLSHYTYLYICGNAIVLLIDMACVYCGKKGSLLCRNVSENTDRAFAAFIEGRWIHAICLDRYFDDDAFRRLVE